MPKKTKTKGPASRQPRELEIILFARKCWDTASKLGFTYCDITHAVAILQMEIARSGGIPEQEIRDAVAKLAERIYADTNHPATE